MPSPQLQQIAEQRRAMRAAAPPVPPDLATRRAGFGMDLPPVPADVTVAATSAGGAPAEWVSAPAADPSARLLYLHGGGYTVGSAATHRRIAADISRATGCVVLNVDYRLAPEAPFPAALEGALAAFRWMLANAPDGTAKPIDTFIAGDSHVCNRDYGRAAAPSRPLPRRRSLAGAR